jgi:hypothetical protein
MKSRLVAAVIHKRVIYGRWLALGFGAARCWRDDMRRTVLRPGGQGRAKAPNGFSFIVEIALVCSTFGWLIEPDPRRDKGYDPLRSLGPS